MATTMDVFHSVARREISSAQGADRLVELEAKQTTPKKPSWMPRWMYVVGIVLVVVLLSPFARDQRN
jgi:hypothetical protein